jgi:hypothetical protein
MRCSILINWCYDPNDPNKPPVYGCPNGLKTSNIASLWKHGLISETETETDGDVTILRLMLSGV